MIKVRGQQVAPAELEDILLAHPGVEDCAVVGMEDAYSGEKPKAFVVVKEGWHGDSLEELGRELLGMVKGRKVRYKWVKEVEFRVGIPRGNTGKVLRRILKAEERDSARRRGLVVRDEEGGERRGAKL